MAVTQYVGSRYVPLFADPIDWSDQNTYEPLTIVLYQGASYTSKQAVPKGISIDNEDFWAITGNYNAQVEQYRQDVFRFKQMVDAVNALIPSSEFSANDTVKAYIDNGIEGVRAYLSEVLGSRFDENETVSEYADKVDALLSGFAEGQTVKGYVDEKTSDLVSRNLAKVESFYAKPIGVYMRKVTIPRSYQRGLVRRPAYAPKPYDYVRSLTTNTVLVNGQLPSVTIRDGVAIEQNPSSPQHWYYFGWDESGDFKILPDFGHNVTDAMLIANGFWYAFGVWGPIVQNGSAFDLYNAVPTTVSNPTDRDYILKREQNSNVFAWDDENVYLYQSDGRSPRSAGVLFDDLAQYLIDDGITDAVLMDGGGSNQLWTTRPAINHTMYNYYAESSIIEGVDYNYQGDTSRDVYSLITFTEV